jgi:hypothetical protein
MSSLYHKKYWIFLLLACVSYHAHAEDHTGSKPSENEIEPASARLASMLNALPNTIDSMPTLLPAQSNIKIVPPQQETLDDSWADSKHHQFRSSLQKHARHINQWFGDEVPNKPAKASVRLMLDSSWNKYDEFEIKPRIRGKIKLPALEKKLSLVFGDDSLDDELNNNVAITNANPNSTSDKVFDQQRSKTDNNSVALRWSNWFNSNLVDADIDAGIRSGDDVYARLKISKDWALPHDWFTRAEQIYRFGSDSEHYLRTNLELKHQAPHRALIANQLNLTYADQNKELGLAWDNRLFRQHAFFYDNSFSYGVYMGGNVQDTKAHLNHYGPFVSWRQPFLRDWFYVQSDINYFNDRDLDRDHYLSAFLRLEAIF